MVLLWLISGVNARRCLDPKPSPFRDGKRVRRSIKQVVKSDRVDEALQQLDVETVGGEAPHIYGVMDVHVGSSYGHTMILSELEREQCWYWRSMGVPAADLWCFEVSEVAALQHAVPASQYIARRFSRVYTALKQPSVEELCSHFLQLPSWLEEQVAQGDVSDLHLAVLIPEPFAAFCCRACFKYLIVPSAETIGWWRAPRWLQSIISPQLKLDFRRSREEQAAQMAEDRAYQMQDSGELAEDMRICLQSGIEGNEDALAAWVSRLQEREDALKMYASPDKMAVFMQMIELTMLAQQIRNAGNLRDVMMRSLRIALPPDLQALAEDMMAKVKKMEKGQLSRAHLTLDVGYMLHERVCNLRSPDRVRYLLWDSSPQFGRDYQMCLIQSADSCDLPSILQSFRTLCELWQSDEENSVSFDEEDVIQQDAHHMQIIRTRLHMHALPTVLIGFGVASFQYKLWALLHSARLEVFTDEGLRQWTNSLLSVASDYGVERRLVEVEDVAAADVVGWFEGTSPADVELLASGPLAHAQACEREEGHDEDMFEDPAAAPLLVDVNGADHDMQCDMQFELPEPLRLSFSNLLGIPGLHHIIDNATEGLEDVMHDYKDNVFLAQQVCRLLRKRDTKPKLVQRCFSHGQGPHLVQDIHKFEGWIHPGRWGTIAFSVPELLKVKHALVACWDEQLFLQGFVDDNEGQQRVTAHLAEDVSKAVGNPTWWAWLSMLEVVCSILREHIAWAESCPCHYHLLHRHHGEISRELKKQFSGCPMRGKRAAELSNGEFLDLLRSLWQVSTVEVLRLLPAGLEPAQRRSIIQEFDRARTHLSFYFALKLTHLTQMPWKILQIAHANEIIAQMAAHEALESTCAHPLVQKLQGPLRVMCERWLSGHTLFEPGMLQLQQFIASLRIVPTSERAVEGQHAKVHRHGLGRPSHTEHFQSYFVRSCEMAQSLESGRLSLESFAWYCQAARNHNEACTCVGLSGHPALQARDHKCLWRDPLKSSIIYHADPFTLYASAEPNVRMQPPADSSGLALRGEQQLPAIQDPSQADVAGRPAVSSICHASTCQWSG